MKSSRICQLPAREHLLPDTLRNESILGTCPAPHFLEVLIVDDSKHRAAANADMIRSLGHAVELACDGIMALRMAAANRPDAVLLSSNLEGLDGCDVAGHLRSDFMEQPPLMIGFASHADRLMRWRCVTSGMDLVLEALLDAEAIATVLLYEYARVTVDRNSDSPVNTRACRVRKPTKSLA